MKKHSLPAKLKGEWIWQKSLIGKINSYVFVRKEFILDSAGALADLWVSASSTYHLFVNGRYIGFGPPSASKEITYADYYDVSYCLETGTNVVALIAHNSAVPCFSHCVKNPGLWCQVNIDDTPTLWTDSRWRMLDGTCYESGTPQVSPGMDFVENIDLTAFPWGWDEANFNDRGWERPDYLLAPHQLEGGFRISPISPPLNEKIACIPSSKGVYESATSSTWVSFADVSTGEEGVYAAQCYIHMEDESEVPFLIASDAKYRLFFNDSFITQNEPADLLEEIGPQASDSLHNGHEKNSLRKLSLRPGWNRFLMVLENHLNHIDFSLTFPTLKANSVKFYRSPSEESVPGWKIAGPLKLGLPSASGSLRLDRMTCSSFSPIKANICDISTYLHNCRYKAIPGLDQDDRELETTLSDNEYIIYELPKTTYGFLCVEFEGHSGDIVDVTFGERMLKNRLVPTTTNSYNTDTVILDNGNNNWMKFNPRACRYVMLSARKVTSEIIVNEVNVREVFRNHETIAHFESSDETLNQIWAIGLDTLRNTAVSSFMDSPSGRRAQFVSDSMIQALAGIYSFGDYSLSEKALREFAMAQFENGCMPSATPCGVLHSVADFMLLWPVWLNYHCHMSGSEKFRKQMLNPLTQLVDFFQTIGEENNGLLVDLEDNYQLPCFLDFGDSIDKRGMVTGLNAIYCRSLLSSAAVFTAAELPEAAQNCQELAVRVANEVKELTWDSDLGLFADCYVDGKRSDSHSLQSNILALYSGIASKEDFEPIRSHFLQDTTPFEKSVSINNNPYFKYFLLETLFAYGESELALKYINYYWGEMIDSGAETWWSRFDPELKKGSKHGTNICQGYGVSPNIFILREVAGIRVADQGFTSIYFNPTFSGLDWVKASVPTPYGKINLEWKIDGNRKLVVDVDSNYPLDIVPMLPDDISENTVFNLGDSVNILTE